jgi:hypothetical protein
VTENRDPETGSAVQAVARVYPWHAEPAAVDRRALTRPDIQGRRAGFVTRCIAGVVDAAIVVGVLVGIYVAVAVVKFLWSPRTFRFPDATITLAVIVGAGVAFVYLTVAWRISGRTWGDELLGLRVVNFRRTRMTWPGAVVRAALCVCFPVGLGWVVVSAHNRSVQDVLLRTSVIYDWPVRP